MTPNRKNLHVREKLLPIACGNGFYRPLSLSGLGHAPVPGAPRKATSTYAIRQAPAWIVKERRDSKVQMERMRKISVVMSERLLPQIPGVEAQTRIRTENPGCGKA